MGKRQLDSIESDVSEQCVDSIKPVCSVCVHVTYVRVCVYVQLANLMVCSHQPELETDGD